MASTEELLYLETDRRCAVCGIGDSRVLTIHHIVQTEPKNESYDNKILLCHNCHHAHHQKKGASAEELQEIKCRLIIKTLIRPGLKAMKEAYRKGRVVAMPFLVNHLVEFGYLKFQEELSSLSEDPGFQDIVIDAVYTISDDGRRLLEQWHLK